MDLHQGPGGPEGPEGPEGPAKWPKIDVFFTKKPQISKIPIFWWPDLAELTKKPENSKIPIFW